MEESQRVIEARKELYEYLDECLLDFIDTQVDLSPTVDGSTVRNDSDSSSWDDPEDPEECLVLNDNLPLEDLFDHPTGEMHRTYERGVRLVKTTYGDKVYDIAVSWLEIWYEAYVSDLKDFDRDVLFDEFGEAGLTMPTDWYMYLNGTLGDLRRRVRDAAGSTSAIP